MTTFETRELSGQLFKNKRREKEAQPNATGEARIDGVLYKVSSWTKLTKSGEPWQSLSFKRADEATSRGERADPPPRRASIKDQLDDEIPFAPEWR